MTLMLLFACGAVSGDDSGPTTTSTGGTTTTVTTTTTGTGTTTTGTGTTTTTGGTGRVLAGDSVLLVPNSGQIELLDAAGSVVKTWEFADLVPDGGCSTMCESEGAHPDGDGLLFAWARHEGREYPGGVVRLKKSGDDLVTDWGIEGFDFPHDAVRDPNGNGIIVEETLASRLMWVADGGLGSVEEPLFVLDALHPDWAGYMLPNGMDLMHHDGRDLLVVTTRGRDGADDTGNVTAWDITDLGDVQRLWQFPAGGATLGTPHGAAVRRVGDAWYLVYAHSTGLNNRGSVGVASLADPLSEPVYLADLKPPSTTPELGFPRGVELTEDGWLYVTDNGVGDTSSVGWVLKAALPALSPTGAGGGYEPGLVDQEIVTLPAGEVFRDVGLSQPFEGWVWNPTIPL